MSTTPSVAKYVLPFDIRRQIEGNESSKAQDYFRKNPGAIKQISDEFSDDSMFEKDSSFYKNAAPFVLEFAVTSGRENTKSFLCVNIAKKKWSASAFRLYFRENHGSKLLNTLMDCLNSSTAVDGQTHKQLLLATQCSENSDVCTNAWKTVVENNSNDLNYDICFDELDGEILRWDPAVTAYVLYQYTNTCDRPNEKRFLESYLHLFPKELLKDCEHVNRIICSIDLFRNDYFVDLTKLPSAFYDSISSTATTRVREIISAFIRSQEEYEDAQKSSLCFSAVKVFYQYMTVYHYERGSDEETDDRHVFINLQEDLDFLLFAWNTGFIPLNEITEAFKTRWKSEDTLFFESAATLFDHPFMTHLSEDAIRFLLPGTAVGGAVTSWCGKLPGPSKVFKLTSSSKDVLRIFAKLLSELVADNDPIIREITLGEAQDYFTRSFVAYSFEKLHVQETLASPQAVKDLLVSKKMDRVNLFVQCMEEWASGAIPDAVPIRQFVATDFTLEQLRCILSNKERLTRLNALTNVTVVSYESCTEVVNEVEKLLQLSVVQILSSYSPNLSEQSLTLAECFSSVLGIEKGWLDEPSEWKWAGETSSRLLQCVSRLKEVLDKIPKDIEQLFSRMASKDNQGKSVLFDTFMRNFFKDVDMAQFKQDVVGWTVEGLMKSKPRIAQLLDGLEKNDLSVKEFSETLKFVTHMELDILSETGMCPLTQTRKTGILSVMAQTKENLSLLMATRELIATKDERTTLEEFGFACYTDPTDRTVQDMRLLVKTDCVDNLRLQELENMARGIMKLLFKRSEALRTLEVARIFKIIADLRSFQNIWNFFVQNPSFVGDGQCTLSFIEQIDGYIHKLRKEKVETIQDFKNISQFVVALLRGSLVKSLSMLPGELLKSNVVRRQVRVDEREWVKFVDRLASINDEMQMVVDVFRGKADPFDVVVSHYEYARSGYCYHYNLASSEVLMSFRKGAIVEELNAADFQLQLGFAVRDDISRFKDEGKAFLEELGNLAKMLDPLQQLHNTGHPNFRSPLLALRCGKNPPEAHGGYATIPNNAMEKLEQLQRSWNERLLQTVKANPWLSLLSLQQTLDLATFMQQNDDRGIQKSLIIFRGLIENSGADDIPLLAQRVAEACTRHAEQRSDNWLDFLTTTMDGFKNVLPLPAALYQMAPANEEEGQQTLRNNIGERGECKMYICEGEKDVVFALERIYGEKGPRSFEVLWCDPLTDATCLERMLHRSTLYPQFRFTIVRSDLLNYARQQQLLQFLLRESACLGNISFIECGESMIRSSSRVTEAAPVPHTPTVCPHVTATCYCGPPASGKTFQFKREMAVAASIPNTRTCWVLITETFSLSDAAERLWEEIICCKPGARLLVGLQFSVGCYSPCEKVKWMELFRLVNVLLYGLLKMRCVWDPVSESCVCIPPDYRTEVLIELPPDNFFLSSSQHPQTDDEVSAPSSCFPLLHNATMINAREMPYVIGDEAAIVARYLKAFDDKTIDETQSIMAFNGGRDIQIALDISGSMRRNGRLRTAKQNLLSIIESLGPDDRVGLTVFNENYTDLWDLNFCTPENIGELRSRVEKVKVGGGSSSYTTMKHCAENLINLIKKSESVSNREQILLTLTDGGSNGDGYLELFEYIRGEAAHIRIILLCIDVSMGYVTTFRKLVLRSGEDKVLEVSDRREEITLAFDLVREKCLTVNEKIKENAEHMGSAEMAALIWKYMRPKQHKDWSRMHMTLWIQYMRRRCDILASSSRFDTNNHLPNFGSVTMEMMLAEAEHAVIKNHVQWTERAHQHMVYRRKMVTNDAGEQVLEYEWSVIATNEEKDPDWVLKLQSLQKLDLCVPNSVDLKNDKVLESYLGYAVESEVQNASETISDMGKPFDFPIGSLPLLHENCFVLTVDYLMKMLLINERIMCHAPCIVMGETGISKTKVVEMLFKLKNSHTKSSTSSLQDEESNSLGRILNRTHREGAVVECATVLQELCEWLRIPIVPLYGDKDSIFQRCQSSDDIRNKLSKGLLQVFREDPSLDVLNPNQTQVLPIECLRNMPTTENVCRAIDWLLSLSPMDRHADRNNWMFVVVNMHAAMSAPEIVSVVQEAAARVHRLQQLGNDPELQDFVQHRRAEICIFFDEFNTSSCMGLLKEIIQDRMLCGKALPENLVPIAACNPYREGRRVHDTRRMNEQGTDWISGHYNVRPLPKSLEDLTWDYGSLIPAQEVEFIERRLRFEEIPCTLDEQRRIARCVAEAHHMIRELSKTQVRDMLSAVYSIEDASDSESRGNSAVSLRDILRFFHLLHYFRAKAPKDVQRCLFDQDAAEKEELLIWNSVALSIGLVYYMRLSLDTNDGNNGRKKFADHLRERFNVNVDTTMQNCIRRVMEQTQLGAGVVKTNGLSENLTVSLLSIASKTPLIIRGSPGTSKTLAIQILCDNANGEFSRTPLYKALPSMTSVHYQCSRHSSSKEIAEVFERAIKFQKSSDEHGNMQTIYFVFMDEAGLPEEERESLKVLHYYLEKTRRSTQVGFVAITNQLLDAAKSNRCNMLLRSKYTGDELKTLAEGCLSLGKPAHEVMTDIVLRSSEGREKVSLKDLIDGLCNRFEDLINSTRESNLQRNENLNHHETPSLNSTLSIDISDVCTDFFSLRDFMHVFKLLGCFIAELNNKGAMLGLKHLAEAVHRNFNGLHPQYTKHITSYFLSGMENADKELLRLANPMKLLKDSWTAAASHRGPPISRYLLVTDTSLGNAVLGELKRLLPVHVIRLGQFPCNIQQAQMGALGDVCWCAGQGHPIMLCGTQSIHESLYDLFNQHYQPVKQDEKTVLRTNIAVGSVSLVCDVNVNFWCIVCVTEAELAAAPAAFLDRLEKYRLTMRDVLHFYLSEKFSGAEEVEGLGLGWWRLLGATVRPLHDAVTGFVNSVGRDSFYGVKENQSVESAILTVLRSWNDDQDDVIRSIMRYRHVLSVLHERNGDTGEPSVKDYIEIILRGEREEVTRFLSHAAHTSDKGLFSLASSVLLEVAQHEIVALLLRVGIPEKLLPRLPLELVGTYLTEEHFELFPQGRIRVMESRTPLPAVVNNASHCADCEIVFTRVVVTAYLERLMNGEINNYNWLDFSGMRDESEFKDKLKRMWMDTRNVGLYLNLSRSGFAQVNFARHCVDMLYEEQKKQVLVLVVLSSVGTFGFNSYDATFNQGWRMRFLDAVGYPPLLPWLRLAYREGDTPSSQAAGTSNGNELADFKDCIHSCAEMLVGVLERVPHASFCGGIASAHGQYITPREITSMLDTPLRCSSTTKAKLHPSLVFDVASRNSSPPSPFTTLGAIAAYLFASYWKKEEEEKAHAAEKKEMRVSIHAHIRSMLWVQGESPHTECLSHTVQAELSELLARHVLLVLKDAIPLLPRVEETDQRHVEAATEVITDVLLTYRTSTSLLSDLRRPIIWQRVHMPFAGGFPYYIEVKKSVSDALYRVYDFGTETEKDWEEGVRELADEWDDVIRAAKSKLNELPDPIAAEATRRVWEMTTSEPKFNAYAVNFIADAFPLCTSETREFALRTVLACLGSSERAIPLLHIVFYSKHRYFSAAIRFHRIHAISPDTSMHVQEEVAQKRWCQSAVCDKVQPTLASPATSSFCAAGEYLPEEMRAVTVMRQLWVLPLVRDVYEWMRRVGSGRMVERNVLSTADRSNRARWHFIRACVNTLNAGGEGIFLGMPELPEEAVPADALNTRQMDGTVREGSLQKIFSAMLDAYKRHVLKLKDPNLPLEDLPVAHSFYDLENCGGGNDWIVTTVCEAIANPSSSVTWEKALQVLEKNRRDYEVLSPVAKVLETVSLSRCLVSGVDADGSLGSSQTEWCRAGAALRCLVKQDLVLIPPYLGKMETVECVVDVTPVPCSVGLRQETTVEEPVNSGLLHRLLHSLQALGLRLLRVLLLRVKEQTKDRPYGHLEDVLKNWLERDVKDLPRKSCADWLANYIGLQDCDCYVILSLPVSDVDILLQFVDHQLHSHAYIFANKALGLKERLPEWVDEQARAALDAATPRELSELTQFLVAQEDKVERNALQSHVDHELFTVLSKAFAVGETMYRQYPVMYKLKKVSNVRGGVTEPFVWLTSHYVALRLALLNGAREKEPEDGELARERMKARASMWTWQTEWSDDVLASPVEGSTLSVSCDFLLAETMSEEKNAKEERGPKMNNRSTRAQLREIVRRFDDSYCTAERMRQLLQELPADDSSPITLRATKLLNTFDQKLSKYTSLVWSFPDTKSKVVDTRELTSAIQFFRNPRHTSLHELTEDHTAERQRCDIVEKNLHVLMEFRRFTAPPLPSVMLNESMFHCLTALDSAGWSEGVLTAVKQSILVHGGGGRLLRRGRLPHI